MAGVFGDPIANLKCAVQCRSSCVQTLRRVVSSRGHLHAVFFQDRQPPVVLQNHSSLDLEVMSSRPSDSLWGKKGMSPLEVSAFVLDSQVGYFLPEVSKLGEVQHESPAAVFAVMAGATCECELRGKFGKGEFAAIKAPTLTTPGS